MATIAEKSRTKEIIDRLQGILNNASPVPLAAGKVTVYKDEIQSLLDELAMQMEAELKTYHEVNDRRGKIINEAKKEAERIIYQAEHSASRMRVSKRSTNVSPLDYDTLSEEEIASLGNANEIYAASLIYTDEMLTEVSKVIEDVYHNIRNDYEIVLQVLEEKMNTIISNKDELMSGLQEMDTEDRSQQILEIGQLLSNELYNERMKRHMASNEYDDGSVQLTLDLQIEKAEENARAAEAIAKQTAEALEQMTEERNALMETVMQLEREQMMAKQADRRVDGKVQKNANTVADRTAGTEDVEYEIVYVTEDELEDGEEYEIEYVDEDEDVEYEIVYVTEDELEDGEEYEIEYVDEDDNLIQTSATKKTEVAKQQVPDKNVTVKSGNEEVKKVPEKGNVSIEAIKAKGSDDAVTQRLDTKEVKEAVKNSETLGKDDEGIPVIPRFKKSEKIASAPSEQIAGMAKAVTTEKKYSGLIGRAVANREKAEAAVTVENTDSKMMGNGIPVVEKKEPVVETVAKNEEKKATAMNQKQPGNDSQKKEPGTEASVNSRKKQRRAKRKKGNLQEQKKGEQHIAASENKNDQKQSSPSEQDVKKDADIKTDANGNQYVQATMQFDDDFEIMEF
ncbi:MAG: hypothetical protein K2L07_10775 [Lachnospiraceae bacterium]|nr:hypothetical protein [Lachnospiraceae bacterium]